MYQHTPVFAASGQVIGQVAGDCLKLRRQASRHLLRRPIAWALDIAALDQAEKLGARWVEIYDTESRKTYRALVSTIRHRGLFLERGFGAQLALALSDWLDQNRVGQLTLL